MIRNLAFIVSFALIMVLSTTVLLWASEFGTAEEAKAMLERAVAAVKEDKAKALEMFNKGEDGFKDRDLYVWCDPNGAPRLPSMSLSCLPLFQ